jgi:hypothetical protein
MSADDFDPSIERLFAQTPVMPDAALFTADVEARLAKGGRIRNLALGAAGLLGGVIAVREVTGVDLHVGSATDEVVAGHVLGQGMHSVANGLQATVGRMMDSLGLGQMEFGALGGMQLFWIAAACVIAMATIGMVRLSQEV